MAGRRPHIKAEEFANFMSSVPEDSVAAGYWRVSREYVNKGGGYLLAQLGVVPFDRNDSYDMLRAKIKPMADKHGPGTFYAVACDSGKKEVPNIGKPRFEFKEEELDMAEVPLSESTGLNDTMRVVKRAAQDMTALQQMEVQQRILDKFLGPKKEEKEDDVKEAAPANGMNDYMMMRMLMDDPSKKAAPAQDNNGIQQIIDAKLQAAMAEMRSMIATLQHQAPKDDGKLDRLMEKLVDQQNAKATSPFQEMMLLMQKQAEERERQREAEDRRREDLRREEERRRDDARKVEEARHEADRKEEEHRRDEERKDQERRRTEEVRREEDIRREEKRRIDEAAKVERERMQQELTENKRRYDEELKIRREEMKQEQERAKGASVEQQKYQMQMFELIKDSKNSGLEITSKVVETMTSAGMSSMKTAQEAAETIMAVAKKSGAGKEEGGGGFGQVLKDAMGMAGPLLAPFAQADAQMKFMQQQQAQRRVQNQQRPMPRRTIDQGPPQQSQQYQPTNGNGMQGVNQGAPSAPVQDSTPETTTKEDTMAGMIAKYLLAYPQIKDGLLGSLEEGIKPTIFARTIEGLQQDTLEGMIATIPVKKLMIYVKEACTPEEQKLVDANEPWFKGLKIHFIELLSEEDEEEVVVAPPAVEAKK